MSSTNEKIIAYNRDIVLSDYKSAENSNRKNYVKGDVRASNEYIYENQKIDAIKIINMLYEKKANVISIIKRTKVGMDGLMIEIAKLITTHPDNNFILEPENVMIITGMSNVSWEEEMKNKIPQCFKENVFHHGKLSKINLTKPKNMLIMIDEIDTGDKEGQKLNETLENAGLLDINYMKENNIYIIFVSATIYKELKELKKWGDKHSYISMTIPETYISHKDFLEMDIIKEFYNINSVKKAEIWIDEDILNNYNEDYRVHIIRTNKDNIDYIKKGCKNKKLEFKNHNSDDKIDHKEFEEIFNSLKINKKHIVIAVKGLFRRANLIPNEWKKQIGAVHENYVDSVDTNVQVQGLIGRMTGYWKKDIVAGHKTGPYRTSIKAIKQYEEFYNDPYGNIKYDTNGSNKLIVSPQIFNVDINNEIEENEKKFYRIPIIIDDLDKNNIIFSDKKLKSIERLQIIKNILENNIKYEKLYKFINCPNVKKKQILRPESEGNYKRNITDMIKKVENNISTSINLSEKDKLNSNWQCNIDSKNYRLIFVIWSLDENLY